MIQASFACVENGPSLRFFRPIVSRLVNIQRAGSVDVFSFLPVSSESQRANELRMREGHDKSPERLGTNILGWGLGFFGLTWHAHWMRLRFFLACGCVFSISDSFAHHGGGWKATWTSKGFVNLSVRLSIALKRDGKNCRLDIWKRETDGRWQV